jgi:cell division protein FtsI (penicillin-binding protein 3)
MKAPHLKAPRLRIKLVAALLAVALLIIGGRAVHLQIYCRTWLSQRAAGEYEKSLSFRGKRGTIYDARGREMAVSIEVPSVAAYPPRIEGPAAAARTLATALSMDVGSLTDRLTDRRRFVWVKRQVTPRETEAVRRLQIEGIDFIPEHRRFYPNRTLAAQLIGFTGIDGHGLEGLEFFYDRHLKGRNGSVTVLRDALGRGFGPDAPDLSDLSGNSIVLTLDRTVQFIAETALAEGVREVGAGSGIAIVMVPRTGAILALAHYPFFNPNAFDRFSRERWRNRSITDAFEPGSTLKIFSAAAALESGGCTSETIFYCEKGAYQVGDAVIHDTGSHEWLTLEKIIQLSSNIGAVKIGEMIGPEPLHRTLRAFGFGEKTGIDCPGETAGSLAPPHRWSRIQTGTIAFGHGLSVSALQLVTAVAALANDGVLMKPRIVQAITDSDGRPVRLLEPKTVRRAVSVETARTVRRMMRKVVESGGTGSRAALDGYPVCGKTGTAQKIDNKGAYADGKYSASFVGFAPADAPEVAILVVVDEPVKHHYGGIAAAPVFRRIAGETLNYLDVPPLTDTNRLTATWQIGVDG